LLEKRPGPARVNKGTRPTNGCQRCGSVSVRLHVSRHFSFDIWVFSSQAASQSCMLAPTAPLRLAGPPPASRLGSPLVSVLRRLGSAVLGRRAWLDWWSRYRCCQYSGPSLLAGWRCRAEIAWHAAAPLRGACRSDRPSPSTRPTDQTASVLCRRPRERCPHTRVAPPCPHKRKLPNLAAGTLHLQRRRALAAGRLHLQRCRAVLLARSRPLLLLTPSFASTSLSGTAATASCRWPLLGRPWAFSPRRRRSGEV
jgi:hypothetical protein